MQAYVDHAAEKAAQADRTQPHLSNFSLLVLQRPKEKSNTSAVPTRTPGLLDPTWVW